MKAFKQTLVVLCLIFALPLGAQAQTNSSANSAQPMSNGVVKKIDAAQGKITISHGPLANLDMPAMTMLFRVADPKMMETVNAGDKVNFVAEKINGALTVTRMEQAVGSTPPSLAAPVAAPAPVASPSAAEPPQNTGAAKLASVPSAQDKDKPADPSNPSETVPGSVYQSAFSSYQAASESTQASDKIWRAANDEMARLGGHAGQTSDAALGMEQKMPGMPMERMPPSPTMPAGHDMKNMNKGK